MVKLTRQEKLMTKISPARAAALEVLVDETDNYRARLDAALNNIADPRDRGLATALANGVTRWKRRLDYIISKLIERPLEKLERPVHAAMRMAIYQMTLMDKVPDHTAVNEAVQIARDNCGQGAGKQTNAVLRRFQREMDELTWPDKEKEAAKYLSIYYSHPLWLVRRWLARFGFAETEELLIRNNEPAPTTLRVNRRWVTREALQNFLEMREVMTAPTEISEWGLNVIGGGDPRTTEEYKEGLFTLQGEGSIIVTELCRPGRNRDGWDMAAGVGGKTTHLAEWVDDSGTLLATDTSAERLDVLKDSMERLGLQTITITAGDARKINPGKEMDYALLDAPCTGTGALRRQADSRWRKTAENIAEMATLQAELLRAGAKAVKPGGRLMYSTCSLEPEENTEVINAFIAENPSWSIAPAAEKFKSLPENAINLDNTIQLMPHRHNTDGIFAALLVKAE